MDRKSADRIIITSNARMEKVVKWYEENKHWIDREPFVAPMESGVVELREEMIEFTFKNKDSAVEITVYMGMEPDIPASVVFEYDPQTKEVIHQHNAPSLPEDSTRRKMVELMLQYDNTVWKEALKYHSLMMFMKYYYEVIEIERHTEYRPAKKKKNKKSKKPLPLVRKVYVVKEFDEDELPKPEKVKRKYTKPDHEVKVRGHLRRYKSGKEVWVRPSVRYKGKSAHHKEYQF